MNRSRRISLIALALTAATLMTAPAGAMAAEAPHPGITFTSHEVGSVISPGDVLTGFISGPALTAGTEFTLRIKSLYEPAGHCDSTIGKTIGTGVFETTDYERTVAFTVPISGTAPDGLSTIHLCAGLYSTTSLFTFENPFTLIGDGADIAASAPVLRGTGNPGATVAAWAEAHRPAGSSVVGEDGTWMLQLEGMDTGESRIRLNQGAKTIEATVILVDDEQATPVIGIAAGSSLAAAALIVCAGAGAVRHRRRAAVFEG